MDPIELRLILQRVSQASVTVEGQVVGQIGHGWLILCGVGGHDGLKQCEILAEKSLNLRCFRSEKGEFDRSVVDVAGDLLVVSQFTLMADTRRGRRPSFTGAASPDHARMTYEQFVSVLREKSGLRVETGEFQAMMQVSLVNDGPATFVLEAEAEVPS